MPNPAVQLIEGIVFNGSVAASGVQNSGALQSQSTPHAIRFAINSTQAGTAEVFRIDATGTARSQGSPSAVAANTEWRGEIYMPLHSAYYVAFTNTSGSTATVLIEAYCAGGFA